jgi:hypothetical protein
MSAVERPGEKEREMVEGGAVGGEDICCGGDRLAASLPIVSAVNVDVPCRGCCARSYVVIRRHCHHW